MKPATVALIVGSLVLIGIGYLVIRGVESVAESIKPKSTDQLTQELGG